MYNVSMKYEWKKSEKDIYLPKAEPTLTTIPKMKYFTISGKGDPNDKEFSDKVGALYGMAYAVRMMPRNGFTPNNYFEYTVYPLEGVWSGDASDKSSFSYTIMIRQPDFVDREVYRRALEITQRKKPSPYLSEIKFDEIEDGLAIQMLHVGAYDDEPQTFAKMAEFAKENGYERTTETHREIYLTDPNRGAPDKQKTVLRIFVKKS